jgi:hypothetical protein
VVVVVVGPAVVVVVVLVVDTEHGLVAQSIPGPSTVPPIPVQIDGLPAVKQVNTLLNVAQQVTGCTVVVVEVGPHGPPVLQSGSLVKYASVIIDPCGPLAPT